MTTPPQDSPENSPADPARTLRIGHAERDEVIEALRDAAAEGRLTTEELTERIERTAEAKVYVDLDAVVADLPVPPPSDQVRAAAGRTRVGLPQDSDEPGHHPFDPLVLRASWDNARRRGRWAPPPFIRLESVGATAEVNFLEAATDLPEIDIEVSGGMGNSVVVVPEDWGVNVDRLGTGWGTVRSKVAAVPQPGRPLVRVHGSIGMGTFTARHAGYFERKRLEANGGG